MTMLTGQHDPIALAIIEALGLKYVRSITYRAGVGEVSEVTVTYHPEKAKADAMTKRFRISAVEVLADEAGEAAQAAAGTVGAEVAPSPLTRAADTDAQVYKRSG